MNRRYVGLTWIVAGGLSLSAQHAPVYAADNTADAANEPELTEIVVTAEKRTENLLEVPISVTAFTDEQRDTIGLESIQDLTNYTPGITYDATLDRMSIRGISRSTNDLSIDPAVATYLDG